MVLGHRKAHAGGCRTPILEQLGSEPRINPGTCAQARPITREPFFADLVAEVFQVARLQQALVSENSLQRVGMRGEIGGH